jgi:acyl transferase domain-containing protein
LLEPYLGQSFLPLLYPKQVVNGTKKEGIDLRAMLRRGKENEGENAGILQETRFAHPLVFSLEYSLAKLLGSWGIHPTSMVGYSLGEYVAACLAGVFSLPDALKLVAERARMIQALPTGSMLTVSLAPNKISYPDGVYLSAHLGESLTVIGGETEAIVALKNSYDAQRIACQLLGTTHAFHTDMMTSAVPELTALAQGVTLSAPRIPYLSNVTGTWLTPAQATDPSYWGRHMCEPVRWHEASQLLLRQEQLLLEVGPGQSLGAFVKQHPVCSPTQAGLVLPTLRYHYDHQPDSAFLWQTVGQLWLHGYELNWGKLSAENAGIPVILPFQLEQDGAENAGIHSPRSSRRRATNTQRTRR